MSESIRSAPALSKLNITAISMKRNEEGSILSCLLEFARSLLPYATVTSVGSSGRGQTNKGTTHDKVLSKMDELKQEMISMKQQFARDGAAQIEVITKEKEALLSVYDEMTALECMQAQLDELSHLTDAKKQIASDEREKLLAELSATKEALHELEFRVVELNATNSALADERDALRSQWCSMEKFLPSLSTKENVDFDKNSLRSKSAVAARPASDTVEKKTRLRPPPPQAVSNAIDLLIKVEGGVSGQKVAFHSLMALVAELDAVAQAAVLEQEAVSRENSELRSKLDAAERTVDMSAEEIDRLRSESRTTVGDEIDQLLYESNKEKLALRKETEELMSQLAAAEVDQKVAVDKRSELQSKLEAAEESAGAAAEEAERIRSETDSLSKKIHRLEEEKAARQIEANRLMSQVDAAEMAARVAVSERDMLCTQLHAAQDKIDGLVMHLEETKRAAADERNDFVAKLDAAETALAASADDKTELRLKLEAFEKAALVEKMVATDENSELRTKLDKTEREAEGSAERVDSLCSELHEAKDEISRLVTHLEEAGKAEAQLRKELADKVEAAERALAFEQQTAAKGKTELQSKLEAFEKTALVEKMVAADENSELRTKLDKAEREAEESVEEVASLRSELHAAKDEIGRLVTQLEQAGMAAADLRSEVTDKLDAAERALAFEQQAAAKDKTELQSKLEAVEETAFVEKMVAADENSELRAKLDKAEREAEISAEEVDSLRSELRAAKDEIDRLATQLEKAKTTGVDKRNEVLAKSTDAAEEKGGASVMEQNEAPHEMSELRFHVDTIDAATLSEQLSAADEKSDLRSKSGKVEIEIEKWESRHSESLAAKREVNGLSTHLEASQAVPTFDVVESSTISEMTEVQHRVVAAPTFPSAACEES